MPRPAPPRTDAELLSRATALGGMTIADLARELGFQIAADPRKTKGIAGQLLEVALGATAGSRAEPDFPGLGVELKTVPVDVGGRPLESTYVCVAPLDRVLPRWEDCWVRHKLAKVLFVPLVEVGEERVIGAPVPWSPDEGEEATLRADWDELVGLLASGRSPDARVGQALQLRPKAASSHDQVATFDEHGDRTLRNPRGFYLRAGFTRAILDRALYIGDPR